MRKIFGGINLTWPKVIIMAIIMGVYTAVMTMIPALRDTSLIDISVSFEVWIFFGIFIILNSKSPKDSAFKCFIFFLISQPLVYIVQDVFNNSNLFETYYKYWFIWTVLCLPMGYIGHYMKKDKWWGLVILLPMLVLLGEEYASYFSKTMFSFPRHLGTTIFCFVTLILYPLCVFNNKKVKRVGLVISLLMIISMSILSILFPPVYSTDILASGEKYTFDDTTKVSIDDPKYGELSIRYEEHIESYLVHAEFKKAGDTKFTLTYPDGTSKTFDITIKRDTFKVTDQDEEKES